MSEDTKTTNAKVNAEARFINFLEGLLERDDRAALASLRRGLGREPGAAIEMHPLVMPQLYGVNRWQEDAYFIVAALFGLYPRESWRSESNRSATNLGASLAMLAGKSESDSTERRFVALLNARGEDLPYHLRQVIGLLKAGDVPIDWKSLLTDIIFWDGDEQRVQRRWSRAFWQARDEDDAIQTASAATLNAPTVNL